MIELIKNLIGAPSVSGREGAIASLIESKISPFVDETHRDNFGNSIALKHGSGENNRKLMITAQMDQPVFFVTFIEQVGRVRFAPSAELDYTSYIYSDVRFESGAAGILVPVPGTNPTDYRPDNLFVDVGAKNREEVGEICKIGDFFVPDSSVIMLENNQLCARAAAARAACAVLIGAAEKTEPQNDIYFVFTSCGCVSARGGKAAAALKPDIAIILRSCDSRPGNIAILARDGAAICDDRLLEATVKAAQSKNINYEIIVRENGLTEASTIAMSGSGTRALTIGLPAKYLGTAAETVSMSDITAAEELICALCNTTIL